MKPFNFFLILDKQIKSNLFTSTKYERKTDMKQIVHQMKSTV